MINLLAKLQNIIRRLNTVKAIKNNQTTNQHIITAIKKSILLWVAALWFMGLTHLHLENKILNKNYTLPKLLLIAITCYKNNLNYLKNYEMYINVIKLLIEFVTANSDRVCCQC